MSNKPCEGCEQMRLLIDEARSQRDQAREFAVQKVQREMAQMRKEIARLKQALQVTTK